MTGPVIPLDISLLLPGNIHHLHVTRLLLPIGDLAVEGGVRMDSLVLYDQIEGVESSFHNLVTSNK